LRREAPGLAFEVVEKLHHHLAAVECEWEVSAEWKLSAEPVDEADLLARISPEAQRELYQDGGAS
jgi:hypothetical protein